MTEPSSVNYSMPEILKAIEEKLVLPNLVCKIK